MRSNRAVYGLQPQGLDGKEEPHASIESMATSYVEEMLKVQPRGPYYLGGVCLGGIVAYEIAQQLQARGLQVAVVVMVDCFLPGKLRYQHIRKRWIEYLDEHMGEMLRRPFGESLQYFLRWAGNGGVLLARALGWRDNSSLAQATRRVAQMHIKAATSYQPQPLDAKVTQLMCSDSPSRSYEDRRLAWSSLVRGPFEVRIVPGNHLSIVEDPNVSILSTELQRSLDGGYNPAPGTGEPLEVKGQKPSKPLRLVDQACTRAGKLASTVPLASRN